MVLAEDDELMLNQYGYKWEEVYITTVTGNRYYFLNPDSSLIDIRDIAWSLAGLSRYNRHLPTAPHEVYSVGQHSVLVAKLVIKHMQQEGAGVEETWTLGRAALMHDSPEAYIGDITGPLKALLRPLLKPIEDACEARLRAFCKLPLGMFEHPLIKKYDLMLRNNECMTWRGTTEGLCPVSQEGVWELVELDDPLVVWSPEVTYMLFMELWEKLRPSANLVKNLEEYERIIP